MSERNGVKHYVLNVDDIDPQSLRFRDLIDISEATGIDPMHLSDVMRGKRGTGAQKLKALAAFVWIVERRKSKSLTYDDVLDGRVEIEGEPHPTSPVAQTKP